MEKVGIEPTTATLARRARFLSCHPHGRRPGPPRQRCPRLRVTGRRNHQTADGEQRPGAPAAPSQAHRRRRKTVRLG